MMEIAIQILRTWTGGPLRQMAITKITAAFVPFANELNGCGFTGRYVCDCCLGPCGGVRLRDGRNDGRMSGKWHSAWLCEVCERGGTRKVQSEAQKQALIDRLAAARAIRRANCTSIEMEAA
jgi:hypothetical protein